MRNCDAMKIMSASAVLHVHQTTRRCDLAQHVVTQATSSQRALFVQHSSLALVSRTGDGERILGLRHDIATTNSTFFNQPAMLCTCKRTAREQADWNVSLHVQTVYTRATRLLERQFARAN